MHSRRGQPFQIFREGKVFRKCCKNGKGNSATILLQRSTTTIRNVRQKMPSNWYIVNTQACRSRGSHGYIMAVPLFWVNGETKTIAQRQRKIYPCSTPSIMWHPRNFQPSYGPELLVHNSIHDQAISTQHFRLFSAHFMSDIFQDVVTLHFMRRGL